MRRALLAALCLAGAVAWGQVPEAPWAPGGPSQPEDLKVYLYTFGPGDEIVSWWGHIALVVEDVGRRQARLYNYGMFSFDKAMLAKFALGRLEFWVGEAPVGWTVRAYGSDNRSVHVQELNLSPQDRQRLAQSLAINVRPENRTYLYDHYRDNCSSRPRDVIDAAVHGQLRQATSAPGRMTLRQHTQRYTSVNPAMSVFLDFMMNDTIDKPIPQAAEAFLPDELERQLDGFRYLNQEGIRVPIVLRKASLYQAHRPPVPEKPPRYEPWLWGLGMAIAALGVVTRSVGRFLSGAYQALIGLLVGLPGTVLLLMWIITNHTVTFHNENLLLANPFTLLLVPLGIWVMRGSQKATQLATKLWYGLAAMGCLGLALKLFPAFDQDNGRARALLLPILLGGALASLLSRRGN
jgi:hypothetical protein